MVVLKYYFSTQNTKKHAALVSLRLKILAPKHSKLPKIIAYCSYKVIKKKTNFFILSLSFSLKSFFVSLSSLFSFSVSLFLLSSSPLSPTSSDSNSLSKMQDWDGWEWRSCGGYWDQLCHWCSGLLACGGCCSSSLSSIFLFSFFLIPFSMA